MAQQCTSNGAALSFEQTLWAAAEYKHVALDLLVRKCISDVEG